MNSTPSETLTCLHQATVRHLGRILAAACSSRDIDMYSTPLRTLEHYAISYLLESERGTALPDVAKLLNMSYSAFRKRFTRITGVSPAHYRGQRTIEEACRLLRETGLTNQEIAERLGFADAFHFSHRFKVMTGHSPSGFREALARSASVG